MSKAERIKEEIGWLKVVFAVAVALDASLIAWFAQNYDTAGPVILVSALATASLLSLVVLYVSRVVYRRLKELEDA